jgi:hypothetical protein
MASGVPMPPNPPAWAGMIPRRVHDHRGRRYLCPPGLYDEAHKIYDRIVDMEPVINEAKKKLSDLKRHAGQGDARDRQSHGAPSGPRAVSRPPTAAAPPVAQPPRRPQKPRTGPFP